MISAAERDVVAPLCSLPEADRAAAEQTPEHLASDHSAAGALAAQKPSAPPPNPPEREKHSTGWIWLSWVLGLLSLGAVGAIAYYATTL